MTTVAQPMDVGAVQAFALIAELGSFTRAAEALDTSQAAVSLKLKRLEAHLGCRLIERTPRRVRLSERGASFLPAARDLLDAHERALAVLAPPPPHRLTLGISDHVAGPELPGLVAKLAATDPTLVIEIHVAPSRDLLAAHERGDLDAIIVRREGERGGGTRLARERFGWFAAPGFRRRDGEPLRLATLAAPCGVRAQATGLLDAAGIGWREVFVGGGVMALGAAITAGLAVAALAHCVAPPGAVEMSAALGLPPLPPADVMLHTRLTDARAMQALRAIGAAFRATGERRAA